MQDTSPTVGNKPIITIDKGLGNKKAPFWLEKGAKMIPHR